MLYFNIMVNTVYIYIILIDNNYRSKLENVNEL